MQAFDAIASGTTTLYGGGTGPAAGTCATTCTSGAFHTRKMLQASAAPTGLVHVQLVHTRETLQALRAGYNAGGHVWCQRTAPHVHAVIDDG